MEDRHLRAPLAGLHGARPAAPAWFDQAMQIAPDRSTIDVAGAGIEVLTWGERGKPGLMFMHGNSAHADWWSFIAPQLANDYRIAAFSWSGMGGSDWREAYSLDLYVEEAFAVAEAAGLFAGATKPVFIGHSFGGYPTAACAARHGERLRAVITIDSAILTPERREERRKRIRPRREPRFNQIYPTFEKALERFRFAPLQPCENLFIADHIARTSLKKTPLPNGGDGWTWKFDPFVWSRYRGTNPVTDISNARCPFAAIWGGRSELVTVENISYVRSIAPPGSPMIEIPDAHHHVMVDQPLALVAALRGLLAGPDLQPHRRETSGRIAVPDETPR